MDAKADTENVEEVEWHGNIEDPSVCGPSRTAGSDEEEDEGKDGTAASPRQGGMDCPMEISSSSDSPGGIFSGEDVITGSEGENSGSDGEGSSYNEDAKEGGPVPAVSALHLRRSVMFASACVQSPASGVHRL